MEDTVIRHIAFFDRMWGNVNDKKVVGDMGFSFSGQSDTRTYNIEKAKKESLEYMNGDLAVECCDALSEDTDGDFAIYELWEADIEMDVDEKETDDRLWTGFVLDETKKLVCVYVLAPKELAAWIEETDYYKEHKVPYYYREVQK